jgi:diacylglycerol O-acyltransferase / wax synthase
MMHGPLAPADSAWLRMDEPTNPMVITAVIRLAGAPSPERLRLRLAERVLDRYPRFGRFPQRHHIRQHWTDWPGEALSAGFRVVEADISPAGIAALVGHRLGSPLPRDRPLWSLDLVRGRSGAVIVARIHHAIGDGFALARVLLSLADEGEERAPPHPAHRDAHVHLREVGAAAQHLILAPPDPPTRLRRPLGRVKRAAWGRIGSVEALRDRARGMGATLNDLYLAALAGALREELGPDAGRVASLRAFVPVNLRPLDQPIPAELGNRFGLVYLPLPVGCPDQEERVAIVHAATDAVKRTPEAVVAFGILEAMGLAPERIEDLVVSILAEKGSAVATNVPGPTRRLHIDGIPMEEVMFWVPQAGRVAIGTSLFSYAGDLQIGVATDAGVIDNPGRVLARMAEVLAT